MPDATDILSAPHSDQVAPSPALNIGSILEAESYFKSPYYHDSYYFPFNPDPHCRGNNYKTYDEMRDDDQVKVALSFKKDIVVNAGWHISCDNKDIEKFVSDSFKRMQEDGALQMSFEDSVRDMLSAYDYGFSLTEPVFKIKNGLYQYDSIRVRPPQSFRFQVSDKGDVTEIIQMSNKGELHFDPRLFLHHVYQVEWGNPYGKSDLRGAHNAWRAKKFISKFLAIYAERFATPTVIGRYPPSWDSNEIAQLTATLKSIQQATTLALPESAAIELLQANRDSTEIYIKALNYYNMHIARALLVPDLIGISGEKTGGGSFALGQDQFKLFLATLEKDRQSLSRKITLRLVNPLVRANFGPDIKCDFNFVAYTMDETKDLFTMWGDMVRYGVLKPNPGEIEYIRKKLNFPEGPVQIGDSIRSIGAKGPDAEGQMPKGAEGKSAQGPIPRMSTVEFADKKRALTSAEKKVDFALIQKSLDASESDLSRRLNRSAKQVWKDYLAQIKESNLVDRFDPKRLTELKPRFLKDVNVVLKHGFADLLEQSYAEAKHELFPEKKFGLDEGELSYEDMMNVLEAEAFNITKDYAGLVSKKVNSDIAMGLKQGLSTDEIINLISDDMPDLTENWINTLVRTKTTEIYNRGRKSYFDNDPLAQQVIEAYQFSAIIDARTTEICSSLDKKVFSSDDENINLLTPPLHFNCRSIIVPVTQYEKDTLADTEDVPDRAELQDMGAGLLASNAKVRKYSEPYSVEFDKSGDNCILPQLDQNRRWSILSLRVANMDSDQPVEISFKEGDAGRPQFTTVLDKMGGLMNQDLSKNPWVIDAVNKFYITLNAPVRVHVTVNYEVVS